MADKTPTTNKTSTRSDIRRAGKSKVEDPWAIKVQEQFDNIKEDFLDETPLPNNFQYDYMFESYTWRAVFLVAFTLGIRFGGLETVINAVSTVCPSLILFFLTHFVIPFGAFHLHNTMQTTSLNIYEIRVILIVMSFVVGTLSGVFNSHCVLTEGAPPTYFFPGIVALIMQLAGPSLAANRRALVATCVGSASVIAVILSLLEGSFTFLVLLELILSAAIAVFNLQLLIGGMKRGVLGNAFEMTNAHLIAIGLAGYKHLIGSRLFGHNYSLETQERTKLSIKAAIM